MPGRCGPRSLYLGYSGSTQEQKHNNLIRGGMMAISLSFPTHHSAGVSAHMNQGVHKSWKLGRKPQTRMNCIQILGRIYIYHYKFIITCTQECNLVPIKMTLQHKLKIAPLYNQRIKHPFVLSALFHVWM